MRRVVTCFTKDEDIYSVIKRLLGLPTIQHFNDVCRCLTKINEQELVAHVTKLHDAQKVKRAQEEEERVVVDIAQEQAATIQAEALLKLWTTTLCVRSLLCVDDECTDEVRLHSKRVLKCEGETVFRRCESELTSLDLFKLKSTAQKFIFFFFSFYFSPFSQFCPRKIPFPLSISFFPSKTQSLSLHLLPRRRITSWPTIIIADHHHSLCRKDRMNNFVFRNQFTDF